MYKSKETFRMLVLSYKMKQYKQSSHTLDVFEVGAGVPAGFFFSRILAEGAENSAAVDLRYLHRQH